MEFAYASIDITPSAPVRLAGSTMHSLSDGIAEPLEANIVALRAASEHPPVLIVTVDLLYPGRLLRRIVEQSFPDVPRQNILLAASHTHRGPMTDDTKPILGSVDDGYLEQLRRKFGATKLMWTTVSWEAGILRVGSAQAEGAINRRLFKRLVVGKTPRINKVVNAPNRSGFKDETVNVLVGEDLGGKTLFVLWNYACHPVGFPTKNQISAHYPHVVRQTLRTHFHDPTLAVGFLQGFSGNIRPSQTARLNGLNRRARRLVSGPIFSDMTWSTYASWSKDIAAKAVEAAGRANIAAVTEIAGKRIERDSALFVRGEVGAPVIFQSIRFSPNLYIVGISAEVVAEYIPMVQVMLPNAIVLCVGCLDHTFGYAPTQQIYNEGGYEAGGYCRAFSLESVNPTIENEMLYGLEALLCN